MVRTSLPRPARLALRLMAVSGVALATANCATAPSPQRLASGSEIDPKYGVKASPRLYNEGDVIPKGGGRRFSGKPYVVAGQTYTPREDARGYVRVGLASWYGSAFHGRMTANGEVFDRHSIAAAHPTLPLPSYARVTNLENGHSMVVRVNDRGPYHAGRVMDVSEEAADALGFHRKGTARIRVEYVGKASVAGSDDRRLLATLRTDGRPAGIRSPVMLADLGPSEEPERYARGAAPLAFKPAPEREEREEAPVPRPVRAPIVLASAAVAVPAAVQPTAPRAQAFRPAPVQTAHLRTANFEAPDLKVAGLNPGGSRAAPAPGLKAAAKGPAAAPRPAPTRLAAQAAPASRTLAAAHPAPAMPVSSKLAMAKLSASAAPAKEAAGAKGAAGKVAAGKGTAGTGTAGTGAPPATRQAAGPAGKHGPRLAGIY
ncbi:septal ring lytic transglycosylase RlpA family protein [Methylobacterium sp. NEAU 140]|uniref:septal ring lytic transglycosylase RlpA family protein n=1 Tax=Methylobacterium sp. NEAU 140 TaxID=3064945 RepID=UPI002736426D|nr:septal ring lytic transglycosylase RlpA family protein [Methylobacterium sp. NEAU 140]MDP4023342.1 septal ring lytic transglycosylase RlpA family protein [Methylobacterium sp. NEAU 140]